MKIVNPKQESVLLLSAAYLPQGITTAREGLKKLIGSVGGVRAMGKSGSLYLWDTWVNSDDWFDENPAVRSVSRAWPVPTILVTSIHHTKRHRSRRPSLKNLYEYFDGVCQICFKRKAKHKMTIEHIHPRSKGGSKGEAENLSLTCFECNQKKGDSLGAKNVHGGPIKSWKASHVAKFPVLREEWRPFVIL
jgi:5-methylcytosine-specific restriction endonuclease McrA